MVGIADLHTLVEQLRAEHPRISVSYESDASGTWIVVASHGQVDSIRLDHPDVMAMLRDAHTAMFADHQARFPSRRALRCPSRH